MPQNDDSKGVTVSVKIYERLLAAYPANFRREYGPAMQQLFRDQCRDAWSTRRGWGLAGLWLRVLLDWAKTSVVEHLLNLHKKESLFMNLIRTLLTISRPRSAFIKVFALVFGGALICGVIEVYLSPRMYSSMAQIQVNKDDPELRLGGDRLPADPNFLVTQSKIIVSYRILTNVIANLRLDEKLARQHGARQWTFDDTFDHLVRSISIRLTPMSSLFDISVKNSDPELAARIANATVDSYKLFLLDQRRQLHLPEAEASTVFQVIVFNPARPRRESFVQIDWRKFLMCILGGTILALLAGAGSGWFAASKQRPIGGP